MFSIKVCSTEIEDICNEFEQAGFKPEIKQNLVLEINEPKEKQKQIENIIQQKNLPVFLDII